MTGVSPEILSTLLEREERRFTEAHPASQALYERAQRSMIGGVPMQWMSEWAGAFPVFAREAASVRIGGRTAAELMEVNS